MYGKEVDLEEEVLVEMVVEEKEEGCVAAAVLVFDAAFTSSGSSTTPTYPICTYTADTHLTKRYYTCKTSSIATMYPCQASSPVYNPHVYHILILPSSVDPWGEEMLNWLKKEGGGDIVLA